MTHSTFENEEWKPVEGYELRYEVSSMGRVRSLPRGNILKASAAGRGYPSVALSQSGVAKTRYIHHLVAYAFLGERPAGMDICHGPNGMTDSSVANLRYDTHHGNMRDSLRDGTHRSLGKEEFSCGHRKTAENTYRIVTRSADGGSKYRDRCKTCLKEKSKRDYALWRKRHSLPN